MDDANASERTESPHSTLWGAATDWSLVRRAGGRDGPSARNLAWEELIARYQRPIEVSVRRRLAHRLRPADVDDGVSAFMSYLFEHGLLARADAARGRFRAFVQGVMNRWVHAYVRSVLAGGRVRPVRPEDIESLVEDDPPEFLDKDEAAWASETLSNAFSALERADPAAASLLARAYGIPPEQERSRDDLAAEEGATKNAVNVRLFNARKKLGSLILGELRELCLDDDEWEAEQNVIIARLRSSGPRLFCDPELADDDTLTLETGREP